jgi:hypothetical protein
MPRKLLVRTPKTSDGVNLVYDDKNQVVYTESILELSARKGLESLNARLKPNLRHIITETDVEEVGTSGTALSNEQLRKRLADLELEDENKRLRERIAELEDKGANDAADEKRTATQIVKDIEVAETVEAVNTLLAEGTEFKTVQTAAAKRIAELEGK